MDEWKIPGLAIAMVQNGEVALVGAYGLRDVEAGLTVTTDTQFLIGSITKSFTSTGLALLMDERRIDWKKPVPAFVASTCRAGPRRKCRATKRTKIWCTMKVTISGKSVSAAIRLQSAAAMSRREIEPKQYGTAGCRRYVVEAGQNGQCQQHSARHCGHIPGRLRQLSEPSRNERGHVQAERDTEARIELHERLGRGEHAGQDQQQTANTVRFLSRPSRICGL